MTTYRPFNLATGRHGGTYVGITARQAVIAAHAQARGDFNTWDYASRYGRLVIRPRGYVTCGDWTVRDA